MISLPSLGNASVPALRRPGFKVSFGSGSADDWKDALVSITVEVGLCPSVDHIEVILSGNSQAPSVSVKDTGSISLGYEDDSAMLVFSGEVESVRHDTQGTVRMTATNSGTTLAKLRVNQSYEQQSASDIVSDLAGQADADTGTVEDGIEFPYFVLDDRRSAYQHIDALAKKSGYLAYFSPEGELNFLPYTGGQSVQTFSYGLDILSLQLTESSPTIAQHTVVGEGAAGSQGSEAWSWLIKDPAPITGNAGDGEPARQSQDSSLRSAETIQSLANGVVQAAGLYQHFGKLLVPGAPAVTVGSTIEISEAPQDALNGQCLVRGVRHVYSKREGFTTLLTVSKTDSGGLGILGGFL